MPDSRQRSCTQSTACHPGQVQSHFDIIAQLSTVRWLQNAAKIKCCILLMKPASIKSMSSCRLRKRQLYKYCSEVIIPPHVIAANLWRVPSVQDVITCYSGAVHIQVTHPHLNLAELAILCTLSDYLTPICKRLLCCPEPEPTACCLCPACVMPETTGTASSQPLCDAYSRLVLTPTRQAKAPSGSRLPAHATIPASTCSYNHMLTSRAKQSQSSSAMRSQHCSPY